MSNASEHLADNQQQLDADGTMVGVSRQALEETLAELKQLRDVNKGEKIFGQIESTTPVLTKRELFAAMAMQGIASKYGTNDRMGTAHITDNAVKHADALIKELEKTS
jgi:hypothetical protein